MSAVNGDVAGENSVAVTGTATGEKSLGVVGKGDAVGVRGEGKGWHGVAGISASTTGGFGVYGANTAGGTGVVGESEGWMGVYGKSKSTTGGAGVMGEGDPGPGVIGKSTKWVGVYGETAGLENGPAGVWGEHKGAGIGVKAVSNTGVGLVAVSVSNGKAGVFQGDVDITGNLTIQGVSIQTWLQRIIQLEQQVQMLSSQVSELMRNQSTTTGTGTGPRTAPFTIDVAVNQSQVTVTGSGFRPGVKCFIIVVYPDFSRKVFEDTAKSDGSLNFNIPVSAICIAGVTVSLSFTVNQADASGHDKFTNTVTKSISC